MRERGREGGREEGGREEGGTRESIHNICTCTSQATIRLSSLAHASSTVLPIAKSP